MELKEYLDGSTDTETILLEVEGCRSYDNVLCDIRCQYEDEPGDLLAAEKDFYLFIQDLFDAAYNHGRHDALTENGFTLAEID